MKFKNIFVKISPLILSSMMMLAAGKQADAQKDSYGLRNQESAADSAFTNDQDLFKVEAPMLDQMDIEIKANNLRDQYLENMIAAQKRLAPFLKTSKYRSQVRKELPGAPVGLHCMYGQYTQLTRALNEVGDTLRIIPTGQNAQNACLAFKRSMRSKYSGPEYAGCIHEGKMYSSNTAYDAALKKYISRQKIKSDNPDSVRTVLAEKFAQKNFSIENINPGAIMIVPRHRGSRGLFHAIMYPGTGIKDSAGNFVSTPDGVPMFIAHNSERLDNLFKTWDTNNVFVADIKKIAMAEYTKEFQRIKDMTRDELIAFLAKDTTDSKARFQVLAQPALLKMARAKYFGYDTIDNNRHDILATSQIKPAFYLRYQKYASNKIH